MEVVKTTVRVPPVGNWCLQGLQREAMNDNSRECFEGTEIVILLKQNMFQLGQNLDDRRALRYANLSFLKCQFGRKKGM